MSYFESKLTEAEAIKNGIPIFKQIPHNLEVGDLIIDFTNEMKEEEFKPVKFISPQKKTITSDVQSTRPSSGDIIDDIWQFRIEYKLYSDIKFSKN